MLLLALPYTGAGLQGFKLIILHLEWWKSGIAGEILPGWDIIASYAYTDAEITKDARPQFVGNSLNNVPNHAFSLWTTYKIQTGSLQGLGVGLGFYYVGDREGDFTDPFEVPDYLRTDAAIFYQRNKFRVALNIANLFDIEYFESSTGRLGVYYGAPLTVRGTISWQF